MMKLLDLKILQKNEHLGLLVLRLGIGGLMFFHGLYKLVHGIDPIIYITEQAGLPTFIAYGVYIGELIAPLLIVIGLATRISAAVLAINTLVAALLVHSHEIFSLNQMGGWSVELLGLFFFGSLALVFTGGGKYAVSHTYLWD